MGDVPMIARADCVSREIAPPLRGFSFLTNAAKAIIGTV